MQPYILKKNLQSPLLITCEHASSRIPKNLGRLGLATQQLAGAKDLFDPGSESLARSLADQLSCSLLLATTSRLVIDYNRRLDMRGVARNKHHAPALKQELFTEINGVEMLVPIPANCVRPLALERQRFAYFVAPYQRAGTQLAAALADLHGFCLVLSVHSFFPTYAGQVRTVDIDVLYEKSVDAGKLLATAARARTPLCVEENKPWSLRDADGGVFKALQQHRGVELLAVDVNNRRLQTASGIAKIAALLAASVSVLMERKHT